MSPGWWRAGVDEAPVYFPPGCEDSATGVLSLSTRDLGAPSALSRLLSSDALCVTGPCAWPRPALHLVTGRTSPQATQLVSGDLGSVCCWGARGTLNHSPIQLPGCQGAWSVGDIR